MIPTIYQGMVYIVLLHHTWLALNQDSALIKETAAADKLSIENNYLCQLLICTIGML